jgi:hypothetical protein
VSACKSSITFTEGLAESGIMKGIICRMVTQLYKDALDETYGRQPDANAHTEATNFPPQKGSN